MINKELRVAAFFIRIFFIPSVTSFKIMHWLSKRLRGARLAGARNSEVFIPRKKGEGNIRLRVYTPENEEGNLPVLLYLHGGGYVLGVPEVAHKQIKSFMKTRACVVVAPDYRKSVEHPYPAALHDCYDTLLWIKENSEQLGVRTNQLMVGGHSAGGGLTAALCLYARDQGEVNISFQMPIYPMIDDRQTNPSAVNNTMPLWNSKSNKIGWDLYLKRLRDRMEDIPIYAAPARNKDFSRLPPAATFVGDIEPFADETVEFVENLKQANIPVQFAMYEGCFHAFETIVPKANVSQEANQFLKDAFAYGVDNYFAAND